MSKVCHYSHTVPEEKVDGDFWKGIMWNSESRKTFVKTKYNYYVFCILMLDNGVYLRIIFQCKYNWKDCKKPD